MYGIDLSVQFENLMPALGLGFLLGIVYDIVRLLRLMFSGNKSADFIADMFFVVFCSGISYLLYIAVNNGHVRLYLLLAQMLGFVIYRYTAGELIFRFLRKLMMRVKKFFSKIFAPLFAFFRKIFVFLRNITEKLQTKIKNSKINSKKALKDEDDLLYNNHN